MGGFVAQRLAVRAPARVAALALLATDPGGPDSVPAATPRPGPASSTTPARPRERATRLISLLFPPELATEIDRQFGELVAAAQAQLSPQTLRAQEAAMDAWHGGQPGLAGRRAPPTLVVHGDLDAVIPAANAAALGASLARRPGRDPRRLRPRADGPGAPAPRRLIRALAAAILGGCRDLR